MSPIPASPLRILLAEDNFVNQKVTIHMLERLGYSASVAVNGVEVLEQIERHSHDLILMDCQMPGMDGFAATREIRRREAGQHHVPVIAMTANALERDRERCLECGMDDYLPKPVRFEDLKAILDRYAPAAAYKTTTG